MINAVSEKKTPLDRRFDRNRLLIGFENQEKLHQSHVMIFGLGGVGSYTAESLARAGVGKLTIVDHDYVCVTNTNRQLHARKGTIGKSKALVMEELIKSINPRIDVVAYPSFYAEQNSSSFFSQNRPDYVVDAIDNLTSKIHLIRTCLDLGIPMTSSMGAAGRLDPTKIRVMDIWKTDIDPLAKLVRKKLRREKVYNKFPVVCSVEKPIKPQAEDICKTRCICPDHGQINTCESKHIIMGSISYITSIFGMTLSGVVVNGLLGIKTKWKAN
ncbi:MAG: tRNA A37 threonylcarbamoyladenosine dehydratase [bacterium]|jgi:tRNA A37 threonylcarbamoyladenosine dehydratase